MQVAIDLVQHIVVLLEDLIFLLERHMADSIICVDKFLNLVLCVFYALLCKFLELSDDITFLLQVGFLLSTGAGMSGVACIEEMIASREELVPQLVTELLWHGTDGLPFLLQSNKLITRSLPVCGVGHFLSLLDELALLLCVGSKLLLQLFEELTLAAEEVVTGGTEALKDLHIHLLWRKADGLPLLLQGDDSLGVFLPITNTFIFFFG